MKINKQLLLGKLRNALTIGITVYSHKDKILNWVGNIYDKENKRIRIQEFMTGVRSFGRMIKASAKGQYKEMSPWILFNTAAAIAYVVSNLDLFPDRFSNFGFIDDLAVLVWLVNEYSKEVDKYELWEVSTAIENVTVV
jgi:uncharacterized membrane protein YkvA (DUF1232 family)